MPRLDDLEARVKKLEGAREEPRQSSLESDVHECLIRVKNLDRDVEDLSVKLEQVADGLHTKIDMLAEDSRLILVQLGIKSNDS